MQRNEKKSVVPRSDWGGQKKRGFPSWWFQCAFIFFTPMKTNMIFEDPHFQ